MRNGSLPFERFVGTVLPEFLRDHAAGGISLISPFNLNHTKKVCYDRCNRKLYIVGYSINFVNYRIFCAGWR